MLNTSLSQRRVVSRETSFHEQFLDVPIRKREPQIPTHRVNNDLGFEMPPFEQRWPRFDHGIFCSLSDSFTELFATQPSISKILGVIGVSSIKSAVCERCLVFGLLPLDHPPRKIPLHVPHPVGTAIYGFRDKRLTISTGCIQGGQRI